MKIHAVAFAAALSLLSWVDAVNVNKQQAGADSFLPSTLIHTAPARANTSTASANIQRVTALVSAAHTDSPDSIQVSPAQPTWTLRVCNAYAYEGSVHIFQSFGRRAGMTYTKDEGTGRTRLTKESGPLPFKRCTDMNRVILARGSLLTFSIGGDMDIATFYIDRLPIHGSMLQLVIKRRDTWSTAADFSSHVFSDSEGPQVALVDAYLGNAKSVLEVRAVPTGIEHMAEGPGPEEQVHFGSVVDIAPGDYEWLLLNKNAPRPYKGMEKATAEFKVADRLMYTVLRVGAEAVGGQSYPEELIVWPSEGAEVHQGYDYSNDNKGLFGIPSDLGKRKRRSGAATHAVNIVALILSTVLATVASV